MASGQVPYIYSDNKLYIVAMLCYICEKNISGTYNGSCILQGYVDEKRLKTPGLAYKTLHIPNFSLIHATIAEI